MIKKCLHSASNDTILFRHAINIGSVGEAKDGNPGCLWIKENKPLYYGVFGFIILALYGVVTTMQTSNFARAYATYGGIFIVMALIWAWKVDNFKPDKYDIIGAIIAIAGVTLIMYAPRK